MHNLFDFILLNYNFNKKLNLQLYKNDLFIISIWIEKLM